MCRSLVGVLDTGVVTVLSALVQQVSDTLDRAHSLLCGHLAPSAPVTGHALDRLRRAEQLTRTGHQHATSLAGHTATSYRGFAQAAASTLTRVAGTDHQLGRYLAAAQQANHTARTTSATIVDRFRADTAALNANTPSGQKALLHALRAATVQHQQLITQTRSRARESAANIAALNYDLVARAAPLAPAPDTPHLPPLPDGSIIWCLRPQGVFGFYRCSVLYPDLSIGIYWSPTDDSGGSLP